MLGNPVQGKPAQENPTQENPAQIITKEIIKDKSITDLSITHSFFPEDQEEGMNGAKRNSKCCFLIGYSSSRSMTELIVTGMNCTFEGPSEASGGSVRAENRAC